MKQIDNLTHSLNEERRSSMKKRDHLKTRSDHVQLFLKYFLDRNIPVH